METYRARAVIEKYSYLAAKEEIIENDYNLNILRYVDTFEEEAPVDLDAVQAELAQVETELAAAQEKMAAYLKELGL